jgi:small subunit ribosomal protein S1
MDQPSPSNPDREGKEPSPEDSSFGEILSQFEDQHRLGTDGSSEARQGKVVSVTAESIFVDVGLKTEGVLSVEEFRDADGNVSVGEGDTLSVTITGRDAAGYYRLSKLKVRRPKDWSSLEKAFAEKRVIGGVVTAAVKGGLSVDVGVRAFMPASRSGARDAAEIETLVGQEIQCKIIKLDVADEDVVVDRRAVLEEEEARAQREAFDALEEGAVVTGTVRRLTQFGTFVDVGGVDGLLHVTDMSWGRVNKPSDVVSVGDSIEVKILKIEPVGQRVSLGVKQLSPDPWTQAPQKYKVGDRVRGKVSKVADFGAFVELEPGVEGLIHLSEMSWSKKTRKPGDVVKARESVEVVVLGVNGAERRIALGLKQTLGDPWEEVEAKFPPGSVVEGPVITLTNFGAFVEVGEGVEGMVHIGDITRQKRLKHPREELSVGQRVRAAVLEVDRERRRMRLGIKQLEPTTADEYIAEHKSGDVVSGRLIEIEGGRARVELGEGVRATCLVPTEPEPEEERSESPKTDLATLTAMLSAKWKQGKAPASVVSREPLRAGQIRSFRIRSLDSDSKTIELELAV